ncbi:MAG: ferredoxin [Saprospiraceae bacterium]|jgi:ferredoxin
MALLITSECINCGACEPACPNRAIWDPGVDWDMISPAEPIDDVKVLEEGDDVITKYFGTIKTDQKMEPYSASSHGADGVNLYYIVPDLCTECLGHFEEPECAAVCPVDCCIVDEFLQETEKELLDRKDKLYGKE